MKGRCNGTNGPTSELYYTGVTYDPKWETFAGFVEDMWDSWQPGLTLDREDNKGNYNKANCRWATRTEQNRNKGNTKLSMEKAQHIRALHASGAYTQVALAGMFGVGPNTINYVVKGKQWI